MKASSLTFDKLSSFTDKTKYSKIFILVDENTEKYCLPIVSNVFKHSFTTLKIPSGERHKNLDTCSFLWEQLAEKNADRNALLINLGGGVITDMGGFVAATYKRGIDFVNIPTTLLAMVDAGIGGKTGIDFRGLKNQIGLFQKAKTVLIEPVFLHTLPQRELYSGFAEVIKYALIADKNLWTAIQQIETDFNGIPPEFINKSIGIKKEIVRKDPFEGGLRKVLNFGHTLGHAVESYFLTNTHKKPLLHGEAVAIGMILATHLSHQITGLAFEELDHISRTILRFYKTLIPESFSEKAVKAILQLLKHDKKANKGKVQFVLLESIGKPQWNYEVTTQQLHEAFHYYTHLFSA